MQELNSQKVALRRIPSEGLCLSINFDPLIFVHYGVLKNYIVIKIFLTDLNSCKLLFIYTYKVELHKTSKDNN